VKRSLTALLLVALCALAAAPGLASAAEPFAEGCPGTALEEGAVTKLNHNPAARKAIVPAGATSLRLCRYYGFGEAGKQTPKTQARAGELQDQAEVHGQDLLESLTLEFKELTPAPKGPVSCPFDEGAEMYAVFSYPHGEPVFLRIGLSGCRFVAGAAPRGRSLNRSLEKRLERLVEGKKAPPHPKHGEVKEKGTAEFAPPHLEYGRAKKFANELIQETCTQWDKCASASLSRCKRKNGKAFGCPYAAELVSGKVCRGSISVKAQEGGLLEESPGVQNLKEGECGLLFVPPDLRERLERENG
jgi:hypothetical protein